MSKAAELAALIGSQSAQSNRNIIINGAMQVWQRGTTIDSISSGNYLCDRWRINHSGTDGNVDVDRSTDLPSGQGFGYSQKISMDASESSLDAADKLVIQQKFEGQNLQLLAKGTSGAKKTTVSFFVKSSVASTYTVELVDNDNTRQLSKSYTINSANTWERKTLTFEGDTSGSLDTDANTSMTLNIYIDTGTDHTSGTFNDSAWASTDDTKRVFNTTGWLESTSPEFYITGVQWELGEQATPFEQRSFADECERCKRYYQKSYVDGVAAGTVTNEGCSMNAVPTSGNTWRYTHDFYHQMRATPTFTFYVPDTGTSGAGGFEGAGDTNKESILVAFSSNKSALYYSTSMDQTGFFMWHYELDAEL